MIWGENHPYFWFNTHIFDLDSLQHDGYPLQLGRILKEKRTNKNHPKNHGLTHGHEDESKVDSRKK